MAVSIIELLAEMANSTSLKFFKQAAYLADNRENGQGGYVISFWYEEN